MRTLEHRRHGPREPTGIHLSAAGRSLARSVGGTLPRFDRVVTSPKPRAVETAEAMGYRVDASVAGLGLLPDDAEGSGDADSPRSFAEYVERLARNEAVAAYAADQSELWRTELERVPDGGSLLMISHGGVIEFGAAYALPHPARAWGRPLGYLEGVRMVWDGQRWVSGAVLRVPR